jgi:hypothetical protein
MNYKLNCLCESLGLQGSDARSNCQLGRDNRANELLRRDS